MDPLALPFFLLQIPLNIFLKIADDIFAEIRRGYGKRKKER